MIRGENMNSIYLKGTIQNIQHSHYINDVPFNKAEVIVKRDNGKEDLVIVKFKKLSFTGSENSEVELKGNIRSYSEQVDGKNKVTIYVFSYFDLVEEDYGEATNVVKLDGCICKKETLRKTTSGKDYIHFILANNLIVNEDKKINSYIPCVAWGKNARYIDKKLHLGSRVELEGKLQSREYKKKYENGETEFKLAHELAVLSINCEEDKNEL